MNANDFFQSLWKSYIEITPQADSVQKLFQGAGEEIINDHVAFRTFANSPIALEKLEPILTQLGYKAYGAFRFENKHLVARCYKHSDTNLPKIFLSELLTHELSEAAQQILDGIIAQIPADAVQSPAVFWGGPLWSKPTLAEYQTLSQESEYAAWLSTIGLKANHFTVSINHLKGFDDIASVNQLLLDKGYTLNTVGGLVKGTPEVFLEQSSTMADKIEFTFADGETQTIPSCFYEFAIRHKQADGTLFDSFIEGNADKIFDSTNQN
ncbi:DUF1338 domain-containing protein [Marinomonas sp. 15G1-11]|uniref:2-oxoadipate dioxygenase/decarboxylase n=1 Tax=Marinomonas phaeophyticola TaxID=3004091 RepID=A0ABT4JZH5_9GAMM|nr:DUF1338 domain-containing protein [Marinomonas sp. 15G1-11]MCZ2723631.1 DUF1338 domain-containing protein [Marinomonas sp. 15G1-11]